MGGLLGNVIGKGRVPKRKILIVFIIVVLVEFVAFYAFLPPFNIHSATTWTFQGFFVICFLLLTLSLPRSDGLTLRYNIVTQIVAVICVVGIVVLIVGNIASTKLLNAGRYASMIDIEETEFEEVIEPSESIDNIALMDTSSAKVVGQRAIGALSDVVSQYVISDNYSQIAYNGSPMKVASLEYADFFKWFNNRKNGIPGYVLVDAVNFEAEYVKIDTPIKYTTSGWFNDNLERHLRFQYPGAIFEGYYLELNEDGKPYYVCPTMTAKIGLFGGFDADGVVVCDPCTGESEYYDLDNVPQWVDRIYDGDLVSRKYNWYGLYSDGFWNSIIGQRDCKQVTQDYGYKVLDNDVWFYTGVTSVNGDASNIGFVMVNARTGSGSYFKVSGAEEFSAMEAAEGQVQHLGYSAAFPALINIDGRPTYCMVLKDKGDLVKQYALVDVKKYSIVATGTTQKESLTEYRKLLRENGIDTNQSEESMGDIYESASVTLKEVRYLETDGDTYAYLTDTDGNVYKSLFSDDETIIFLNKKDKVTIYYEEDESTNIRNIVSWQKETNE